MSDYTRTVIIPLAYAPTVLHDLATKYNNKVGINYKSVNDRHYVVAKFISSTPYVYPLASISIVRNTDLDTAKDQIRRTCVISDMDQNPTLAIAWGNATIGAKGLTTAESVTGATITVTDGDGVSSEARALTLSIADAQAAVITATGVTLSYAEIAAWDNDTLSITDNTDDVYDIDTASTGGTLTVTYKNAAGSALGTNTIAGFRTYLADVANGVPYGGMIGSILYAFTDDSGNVSTPVEITVKSKYRPTITNATTLAILNADLAEWTGIVPTATGEAIPPAEASSVDASASVTIAYYQSDDTTPIADLADFKTYLTGAGETTGHIHLGLSGAAEVNVTVTKAAAV